MAYRRTHLTPRFPSPYNFLSSLLFIWCPTPPPLKKTGLCFFIEINEGCLIWSCPLAENTFIVPLGKPGKEFGFELSRLLRAYADGTALESIALVICPALTETFLSLKTKDHFACLERRLLSWKKREFAELLWEGCSIQSRLTKSVRKDSIKNYHIPSQSQCSKSRSMPPFSYLPNMVEGESYMFNTALT